MCNGKIICEEICLIATLDLLALHVEYTTSAAQDNARSPICLWPIQRHRDGCARDP